MAQIQGPTAVHGEPRLGPAGSHGKKHLPGVGPHPGPGPGKPGAVDGHVRDGAQRRRCRGAAALAAEASIYTRYSKVEVVDRSRACSLLSPRSTVAPS